MLVRVKIRYRADKRIRVVEVKAGKSAFLSDLDEFAILTGINDFTESHMGEAVIDMDVYRTLLRNKVTTAEPSSFRFRHRRSDE